MILKLLILAVLFGLLFALGELLHRLAGWRAENSRKVVHASVGLLALSFPLVFEKLWPVALLCGSFLLILVVSLRFGWLPSINKVKRKTVGSVLFPIVVALCFWVQLRQGDVLYFYLPVLIMAICDPLAASLGNAKVEGKKSLRGFLAFAVSAFLLSLLLIGWLWWAGPGLLLLTALAVALVSAVAEYFSRGGWDNFTIPLSVVACLLLIQHLSL